MVGWLFLAQRLFETVFQAISGRLPERGRKKREMIDERQPLPAPTASAVSPCPSLIQSSLRLYCMFFSQQCFWQDHERWPLTKFQVCPSLFRASARLVGSGDCAVQGQRPAVIAASAVLG